MLSSTPEFFAVSKQVYFRFKLQKQAVFAFLVELKQVIRAPETGLETNLDYNRCVFFSLTELQNERGV